MMTADEKAEAHHRFREAVANAAVEDIHFTDEENALFEYMIEQGYDENTCLQIIKKYLAGQFTVPAFEAAE